MYCSVSKDMSRSIKFTRLAAFERNGGPPELVPGSFWALLISTSVIDHLRNSKKYCHCATQSLHFMLESNCVFNDVEDAAINLPGI